MPDPTDSDCYSVEALRLAAWLRLNGEDLLERRLEPDGRIVYVFRASSQAETLISSWQEKSAAEIRLDQFASIVSFEIRKALDIRRKHGVPLRLTRSFPPDGRDPRAT